MSSAPNPVLSTVSRSDEVESWHRGAVAVWHAGEPVLELGDVAAPVFARSVVKPLQALPLFERGVVDRLDLSAAERAILCASHDGTEEHVAVVRALLQRSGLREELLGCGPHAPFAKHARLALLRRGERPLKVHNNCSGKHTGFLLLARECGDDLGRYLEPDSGAQRLVNETVAEMAGLAAPLPTGLDGCGAPTFRLSLRALARAFCRLANPDDLPAVRANACRSILTAVGAEPEMLAGRDRLCTAIVRAFPGRAFAKNGAEGVYAVALAPDPARARWPGALALVVKIDDGAERGYQPVVLDLLRWLGAFGGPADAVPEPLARFWRVPVHNTQQKRVGEMRCVVEWGNA